MPKFYDHIERLQLETKTSDYAASIVGIIWWHSTDGKIKTADGTNIRALLRNDDKLVIGNHATASTNVRLYRSGTSKIQIAKGDDATAEGSVSASSFAEVGFKLETYSTAGRPAAGNAGRPIYNSTDQTLQWDDGSNWISASSTTSSGSVDAVDFLIQKNDNEKFRGVKEQAPNSVGDAFVVSKSTFQCYLLEDYTASAATMKLVVNPMFANSGDKQTDATAGWSAGANTSSLTTSGTKKIGTASLSFNKDGAATTGFISRTAGGESVYENANLYFWISVPSGISGTLANVFVRCGSDSSNYRTWSVTTDYAGTSIATGWNLIKIDVSDTTGTSATGTGWTTATTLTYFAIGITTDAAGDTQAAVLVDAIFFADSSGKYAALGDELTIYDATNRESLVIGSGSTSYNGVITLGAALANNYSAVAATVIKRNTMTTAGEGYATMTDGLSGNINKTQEIRIRRILPESIDNKNFKAFTTFITGEYFFVKSISGGNSITVETNSDISANWLNGRVVEVAQRVGDGNGGYEFIPRSTTYTMDSNATYSNPDLTIPLDVTTNIAVGDLVFKKQVDCQISLASTAGNESFQAMTKDRVEILNPGLPYVNRTTIWAHWPLAGPNGHIDTYPGGGTSGGLDLTVNGTITTTTPFNASKTGSSDFSDSNYYSLTTGNSEPLSGDSGDVTDFAISFWFKATAFTGTLRSLFNRLSGGGLAGWRLALTSGANTLYATVEGSDFTSGNTFNVGAWNHVYLYLGESTGGSGFWLNGTNKSIGSVTITDAGVPLRIGRFENAGSAASGVSIADVVVWRNPGAALSSTQVAQIYNNGAPLSFGVGAGLKYRWSKTSLTGQKLSMKAIMDRAADTDDPMFYSIGVTKS